MPDTSLDEAIPPEVKDVDQKTISSAEVETISDDEQILQSIQFLLRFHHIEKSVSSIRELADNSEGPFDFRDAVSALRNLEFSANVGTLSLRKLTPSHCPAILKFKDKAVGVLIEIKEDKSYVVFRPENEEKIQTLTKTEFKKLFSKSILLAKSPRQNRQDSQPTRVNWFWGSLIQSKWTYIQVLMAAGISNFLGLSTSLFIMRI